MDKKLNCRLRCGHYNICAVIRRSVHSSLENTETRAYIQNGIESNICVIFVALITVWRELSAYCDLRETVANAMIDSRVRTE